MDILWVSSSILGVFSLDFFPLGKLQEEDLEKMYQKSVIEMYFKLTQFLLQVSPLMEAEELTNDVLGIKNIIPSKDDIWAAFEVLENGELG